MRKLIALALMLVLCLTAANVVAEGKLVVYTPNPDAEIQFILNTFAEKYNVEIEMLSMGTGECYTRLVAEKDAPIADVMFGGVESKIAQIVYGIPAIKAVEFGLGSLMSQFRGSMVNDAFVVDNGTVKTATNYCGGILGGITTGMPVIFKAAVKPTPSIAREQQSVNLATMENTTLNVQGRHDPCIVPRVVPVLEAAAAIAIYDLILGNTQTERRK